jgi:hypothetical protein
LEEPPASHRRDPRRARTPSHWQLADGTGMEIVDIIDDHSGSTIASSARTVFKPPT